MTTGMTTGRSRGGGREAAAHPSMRARRAR
jgi:hypothetical protein